jgi:hypothetical protein
MELKKARNPTNKSKIQATGMTFFFLNLLLCFRRERTAKVLSCKQDRQNESTETSIRIKITMRPPMTDRYRVINKNKLTQK